MTYREGPTARSNGCIASTLRLKTDFFGRATAGGARRKGAERKTSIRLELIRRTGKSPLAGKCVVGLRGIELQARSSIEPVSVTAQCCKRGRIAPAQK